MKPSPGCTPLNSEQCDSFLLFFNTHDKSGYPWWFQWTLAMNQVQLLDGDGDPRTGHLKLSTSHMTPSQITKTLTSIALNRTELKPCARCHCVLLVMTDRLICKMNLPGSFVSKVILPDLRSSFQIGLSGSKCICFDASRHEDAIVLVKIFYLY